MRDRLVRFWVNHGPTAVSGDLAIQAAAVGVLSAVASAFAPDAANVGGGVAIGMWFSAQYANAVGQ